MKRIKLLFATILTSVLFTSCIVENEIVDNGVSLNELVSSYDLWYVDVHRTTGNGDIPFLQKAFTISLLNGTMYANNNIVDIGKTGNGFGIIVGNYRGIDDVLEINHTLDGAYDFRVVQLSGNEIRLDDLHSNLSYYLVGYQRNQFDYDKLFYDNIEYFLQEFIAWERIDGSGGTPNPFDNEHFLQFTPENTTTFYSSHDPFGTNIDNIKWGFAGGYKVHNVQGVSNLKYLTLNYDNGDTEEFDLTVIDDETVKLYHVSSQTTYVFRGRGFIQYLKGTSKESTLPAVRNNNRKRTKVNRETVLKRT